MSWVVHKLELLSRYGILWTWKLVPTSQWLWQEYQAQKLAQLASKSSVCKKVLPDTKKLHFLYWQIEILKKMLKSDCTGVFKVVQNLEKLVKILKEHWSWFFFCAQIFGGQLANPIIHQQWISGNGIPRPSANDHFFKSLEWRSMGHPRRTHKNWLGSCAICGVIHKL